MRRIEMIKPIFSVNFFIYILVLSASSLAQDSGLYIPLNIKKAYENETRSMDGIPGSRYWQNRADYKIDVDFNPINRVLSGKETIVYYNNSPGQLDSVMLQLLANLYKRGNPREFEVEPEDESDGVNLQQIVADGRSLDLSDSSEDISYQRYDLSLSLHHKVSPGAQTTLQIQWNYTVNHGSSMRTGQVDSTSYFIAYFFPRVAAYDDIDGWTDFQYSGVPEFYNDFGNFDLTVTVPNNFIVWATGTLINPEGVLSDKYSQRYRSALKSDKIIHIIDSTECSGGEVTASRPNNTWHFTAENISDVAFGTSDHYCWDASSLIVDKENGRRVLIDAAYDKHSKDFYEVAEIARKAIHFMSTEIPGVPFPYPQETVFNGNDGMEYPMMVNDHPSADQHYAIKLTSHEISHSYFPFFMGINETSYAWMDEGFASFCDYLIVSSIDDPKYAYFYYDEIYKAEAGNHMDTPMFANSEYLKRPVYHMNSYPKPGAFLMILKDVLGDETFKKSLHIFMERWNGKHPIPYDFFFTFNETCGQNLDWLIRPWFYEFGYVDLGISSVIKENDRYRVKINRFGNYPAPVYLEVNYADSSSNTIHQSPAIWKNGEREYTIELSGQKEIISLKLQTPYFVDAVLNNDEWTKTEK